MVWKPGRSGNPNGRPVGKSDITKLREAIAAHIPEIINRLVVQAKDGDTTAAKLLLERTLPPIRQKDETLKFALPKNATLVEQGRAIAFELLYNQQLSEVLRIKGSLKPLGLDSEPSGFVLLQKI